MHYKPSQLVPPGDLFNSEVDPRLPYATRVNSYEAYPGGIPPLDLTAVAVPNDHGIRQQLRDLGVTSIDPPGLLCNRVHQGRMYTNLSWVLWMADILPGADAGDLERQLFGQHIPFHITRPGVTAGERWRARLFRPRFFALVAVSVATCKGRLLRYLDRRKTMGLESKTNQQLDALIEPCQASLIRACGWNTRGTLGGLIMIGLLTRLVGADKSRDIVAILSDLGEVESAAPAQRIQEIAGQARRKDPELAATLKGSEDRWGALRDRDREAHEALRAVVDRYGYRSVAEHLISVPSWADDPTPVMDAFVGLLGADAREDRDRRWAREAAQHSLLEGAGFPRRLLINSVIRLAHAGARTRERTKAGLIIRLDMLRQLFREIGRRLVAEDRLDDAADLYYLTLDEVRAALSGGKDTDLRSKSSGRKREVERLRALPEVSQLIRGHEPVSLSAPAGERETLTFKGLGVAGTKVEGYARVVNTTDDLDVFEPGEILVAPYTDAGWTPYFTLASAVVVETGGLLTHTSTVARELGLPAVVNISEVTTLIKTGDLLCVDPENNEVRVLERNAPAGARQSIGEAAR